MTPQEEATQIFGDVVRQLTSPEGDLKLVLRCCLHACQVLDWADGSWWFQRQLVGYEADAPLPSYRLVTGQTHWQTQALPIHESDRLRSLDPGYQAMRHLGDGTTVLELRAGIDWILHAARTGYSERTGNIQRVPGKPPQSLPVEQVKVFDAVSFARVANQIEDDTFAFASAHYRVLKYGNALTDIWEGYRLQIDAALGALGLADHLESIQAGLQSDTPAARRTAALGCRNLLHDVANHLWQDPRETYEQLKGNGPGGKLRVTSESFANRLSAYLHQKGLTGDQGKFLRDELERLAVSIRSLVAEQSGGHGSVSREDARLVALATYFILGALVTKTDMVPITAYQDVGG